MNNSTVHFLTVFMAFFALMNPVANASLFIGMTEGIDTSTRRAIALRAVLVAFAIIVVLAIVGREIFSVFGITLPAFRIAGGIMIGLIGFHMLQGDSSTVHTPGEDDTEQSKNANVDMSISPIGIPVLAGPGTIATAMNFAAESTLEEIVRVVTAFGLMCVITFAVFVGSHWLVKVLGQNVIKVITRLMGMILAVIGTQMLIEGIRGAVAA